jgi:hypothetical protein
VVRVEKIDVNTRLYELEASRRKHLLISADALLEEEMWAFTLTGQEILARHQ